MLQPTLNTSIWRFEVSWPAIGTPSPASQQMVDNSHCEANEGSSYFPKKFPITAPPGFYSFEVFPKNNFRDLRC